MAKNLVQVQLQVNADVKQAKKEMESLQKQLTEISSKAQASLIPGSTSSNISNAIKDVAKLKVELQNAFNVDTGKLDFSRFSQGIKESGKQLKDYANSLSALGPEGNRAFMQIAQAVATSEIPVLRLNKGLAEMWNVMKNTMRWQISSSVLHGFMGNIQQALSYVKDLNASLNKIQIVTGQSSEQMAAFAERANKAAQALSTTTTAYTDAALIFYQQGLSDDEVEKRTTATIKMAQAAGESATEVSSYMTAIWNNFADGSDNLERYADVITKLGAATAASSAEIAGGLEKFAAVAETVGLSFDYAAAAVTTIVDKTRQSEDVVGTSLKTIFARLEGLQLNGQIEEDGITTDLNKYSKALLAVGVNIKDNNGNLKDMDQILNELGPKWKELSKDQQVALAQTVGGMRQYNQFIALMDNFEAFQKNISLAKNAEGTLTEQADIYADSWEASEKRVKAAAEAIYQNILDDDFFIKINDFVSDALKGVNNLIDAFGGVKGVLLIIGSTFTNIFKNQIASGLNNLSYNLKSLTKSGRESIERERANEISNAISEVNSNSNLTDSEKSSFGREVEIQEVYLRNEKNIDDITKSVFLTMEKTRKLREADLATLDEQKRAEQDLLKQQQEKLQFLKDQTDAEKRKNIENRNSYINDFEKSLGGKVYSYSQFSAGSKKVSDVEKEKGFGLTQSVKDLGKYFKEGSKELTEFNNILSNQDLTIADLRKALNLLRQEYQKQSDEIEKLNIEEGEVIGYTAEEVKEFEKLQKEIPKTEAKLEKLNNSYKQQEEQLNNLVVSEKQYLQIQDELNIQSLSETFVAVTNNIFSTLTAVNTLKEAFTNLFADNDMSISEKLLSTFTAISLVIPGLVSSYKGLGGVMKSLNLLKKKQIITNVQEKLSTEGLTAADGAEIIKKKLGIQVSKEANIESQKEIVTNYELAASRAAANAALAAGVIAVAAVAISAYAIYDNLHKRNKKLQEEYENSRPAEQLQRVTEATKDAKQQTEDATQAYQELKDKITSLDDGIKSLEDLTRGTLEYKEAVKEANESLVDLLINQGMLDSKNYTIKEGGLMVLTDEAKEKMLYNSSSAASRAKAASYTLQAYQQEKQAIALAGEISGENQNTKRSLGAAYEAQTAKVYNDALNLAKGKTNIDDLLNVYKESEIPALEKLAQELSANTSALSEMSGQEIYGDVVGKITENEDLKQGIYTISGARYNDLAIEDYQKWVDFMKAGDDTPFKVGDDIIQLKYAELMGYDTSRIEDNTGGTATYHDYAGNVYENISDDVAIMAIVQDEIKKQTESDVQELTKKLEELSNKNQNFAKNFTYLAQGYNPELKQFDVSNLIRNQKVGSTNVKDYFSNDELEAIANAMGTNPYVLRFMVGSQLSNVKLSDPEARTQKAFANREFTYGGLEDFSTIYQNQAKNFKLESKSKLQIFYQDLFEKAGQGNEEAVIEAIKQVDFSSRDAFEQLDELLKSNGVYLSTDDLEELKFGMSYLFGTSTVNSLKEISEKYAEMQKVLSKVKEGLEIDAALYDTLSDELKQYFYLMADGTYRLIGDAEDFYKAVNQSQEDNFKGNTDYVNRIRTAIESSEDYSGLTLNKLSDTNDRENQLGLLQQLGYINNNIDVKQLASDQTEYDKILASLSEVSNDIEAISKKDHD